MLFYSLFFYLLHWTSLYTLSFFLNLNITLSSPFLHTLISCPVGWFQIQVSLSPLVELWSLTYFPRLEPIPGLQALITSAFPEVHFLPLSTTFFFSCSQILLPLLQWPLHSTLPLLQQPFTLIPTTRIMVDMPSSHWPFLAYKSHVAALTKNQNHLGSSFSMTTYLNALSFYKHSQICSSSQPQLQILPPISHNNQRAHLANRTLYTQVRI